MHPATTEQLSALKFATTVNISVHQYIIVCFDLLLFLFPLEIGHLLICKSATETYGSVCVA